MKNIFLLKICKVKGAQVESTTTYAFENENQINSMVDEMSKDPNCRIGKNPGTLIFKEQAVFFEETDNPQINSPQPINADPLRQLSKGLSLPWFYKRPFR